MKIWHLDRVLTVLENRIRKLEAERTQIRSKAELAKISIRLEVDAFYRSFTCSPNHFRSIFSRFAEELCTSIACS